MKQPADLKCEKNRANENQAAYTQTEQERQYSKPKLIVVGDSIVRNIQE